MTGRRPPAPYETHTAHGGADRDFMRNAACRGTDPETFFVDREQGRHSTNAAARRHAQASALAICRTCPVQTECLEYALKLDCRYGIYGGQTEKQRYAGRTVA